MQQSRDCLLFLIDQESSFCGSSHFNNFSVDFKASSFVSTFAHSCNIQGKDLSEQPEDYEFYAWNHREISLDTSVGQIPKPGIIIAIRKHRIGTRNILGGFLASWRMEEYSNIISNWMSDESSRFEPLVGESCDVFVSYSHSDTAIAKELTASLESLDLKCFNAEKCLSSGSLWEEGIRVALHRSTVGLIVLTPNSLGSKWVMCEAGAFWVLGKSVVPALMYVSANDLPELVTKHQAINIETSEGRSRLCEEVAMLCGVGSV